MIYKLSDRLMTIAGLVKQGETMADIGTDHGYLPLFLLNEGISPRAIATDISLGSVKKAENNYLEINPEGDLEGAITPELRWGDGLKPIKEGEVDTIVMAGMGGLTIAEILDWDLEKSHSYKRLILHPTNNGGRLRFYLVNKGFSIESESIVREKSKFAEIIEAIPAAGNKSLLTFNMLKNMEKDFTDYDYPKSILKGEKEVLKDYLLYKISEEKKVMEQIQEKRKDEALEIQAYQYRKNRVDRLENLLKELN